jgi:small subunit ribosomal protein S6
MNTYETIIIAAPQLPEAKLSEINSKVEGIIKKHSGAVKNWDDWGNRRLSYNINKQDTGHYVYVNYNAQPTAIAEVERSLKLSDDVLKFFTVCLEKNENA